MKAELHDFNTQHLHYRSAVRLNENSADKVDCACH